MHAIEGGHAPVLEAGQDPGARIRALVDAGDREAAYAQVVEATKDSLYRFLLRMLRDDEAAREVFQDAYVRVFQALDGFRGEASVTTWVLTIGRNLALNRIRRSRVRDGRTEPLEAGASVGILPASEPATRSLLDALGELPEAQREAVLLYYVEERTVAEVARVTGRPINTIKSDLWRARQTLRRRLGETR